MSRLNQAAFDLLDAELQHCLKDSSSELAYQFAIGRLQRLCHAEGQPIAHKELRKVLSDLAPNIRDSALRKAAAANYPKPTSIFTRLSWNSFAHPTALFGTTISMAGLLIVPLLHFSMPGFNFPTTAVAEIKLPQFGEAGSGELVQTAKTFASITNQSMKAKALSAQEWQTIVNQWQESIELLQQVPASSRDYKTAQTLIAQYQHQQQTAKQHLIAEKSSAAAFKVATARVRWFSNKARGMNPQEKANAIAQIDRQLKPVTLMTTHYEQKKELLETMKKQMR